MNCACPDPQERENSNRWTDRIDYLLLQSEGRAMFKKFLAENDLLEDLDSLQFYEDVEDLSSAINHMQHAPTGRLREKKRIEVDRRRTALLEFAIDRVNLDLDQIEELKGIMGESAEALEILSRARQTAKDLLADTYEAYRRSVVRSQNTVTY